MKLSKGALTMLLAQYRAIYKNAFFKGLASAALATAVLASGSAQAEALTGDITDNKVVTEDFTIEAGQTATAKPSTGDDVSITITGNNAHNGTISGTLAVQNGKNLTISLNGGSLLAGETGEKKLSLVDSTGGGKLTLTNLTTNLSDFTLDFGSADDKSGTIVVGDKSVVEFNHADLANLKKVSTDPKRGYGILEINQGTLKLNSDTAIAIDDTLFAESDDGGIKVNSTGGGTLEVKSGTLAGVALTNAGEKKLSVKAEEFAIGTEQTAATAASKLKDITVSNKLSVNGTTDAKLFENVTLDGANGTIEGNDFAVQDNTTLTVSQGNWTSNVGITLGAAGSKLTIGDANKVSSLNFADGKGLTLTNGEVTVQNTTFDLTRDDILGNVAATAKFNVVSGGTVNITSANLTGTGKLTTGIVELDAGGILNVTDDLTISDGANLVASGAAGKIGVKDGTLKGKGITVGDSSKAVEVTLAGADKSNLEFDSYTFKAQADASGTVNNKTTLKDVTLTAHGDITVTDGTNNGTLIVGNTNAANLKLVGAGTVNVKELQFSKGSISVDGAWTVNGKLSTATEAQTLGMTAGSSLAVNQLALDGSAALTISGGDLTIAGTDATGDIDLKADLTVGKGSTLTIGKLAVDDIINKRLDDKDNIIFDLNKNFAGDKLKAESSTATLKLDLNNTYVFTNDTLNAIKKGLETFTGFINFGDAKFDGAFKPNAEGRYNYSDVKNYAESKFTNNILENAVIETKSSDATVMGSFGSLYLADAKEQTLAGPTVLNKADGSNHFISTKDGAVGDAKLADGAELVLKNGGEIGKVTLEGASSLLVASGNGKTVLGDVTGATAKAEFTSGTVATGAVNVQDTKFSSVANADVKSLTTKSLNVADSSVKVAEKVELTNAEVANISNSTLTAKDFTLNGTVKVGDVDKNKVVQIADLALSKGGNLVVDGKLTSADGEIAVGFAQHSDIKEAQPEATYASMFVKDASAFTGSVTVESGEVGKSSIAVFASKSETDAGPSGRSLLNAKAPTSTNRVAVNFDADAGKNGVLAFGYDSKDAANKVLVDNGLLTSANGALGRNLESIALVNSQVVLADGKGIELNGGTTNATEDVQLGKNSAIVLTNEAFNNTDKTAIKLAKVDGTVGFDKLADADKSKEAKILLAGKFTVKDVLGDKGANPLKVFGNAAGTGDILNNDGLQIETVNGLLKGTIGKDGSVAKYGLADNYRGILYQASSPVAKYIGEYLSGTVASTIHEKSTEAQKAQAKFFDTLTTTSHGLDIEQAARYAVYGGTVKAAELASKSGSEAILAYAQGANTVATAGTDNGSIFVVPTYKSSESDSFGAEGVEYGTDIKLKGVSLGADYAINPNFKLGAMFNIGTGESDGKSIASGIESDVDYVGGGLFATFTNGALKVVSDITYTDISSDVKSSIGINNYTADSDASVLSLGVNGEYKFDLDGSYVTPHAGVRYSKYDIDDVTVKANGKDFVKGSYDSMSVVSMPFGVTVGTDMLAGDWMLQPSLDLGVTFNIGDTDVNHSAIAFGVADSVGLTSEILDDVVFGIKGGLKASYNNLSIGLGVGYEVGSNADDLSVQASGVYTF